MANEVENWRDSSDYRVNYFAKNKGLFGKLYFCAYCKKPMWRGIHKIQVDHIYAPSRTVDKDKAKRTGRNTSFAAEWINKQEGNLVASCPKCNREKSDKAGKYLIQGYSAKVVEKSLNTVQDIATLAVWSGTTALGGVAKAVLPESLHRPQTGPKKPALVSGGFFGTFLALLVYIIMYVVHLVLKVSWKTVWWVVKVILKVAFYPIVGRKLSWKTRVLGVAVYGVLGYFLWKRFFQ